MTPEFHRDDRWWVSPFNVTDQLRRSFSFSDDDFEAVRQITKLGLPSKIYTFVRAIAADIDKSLECGTRGVILEIRSAIRSCCGSSSGHGKTS
jgi:hypothetical protein